MISPFVVLLLISSIASSLSTECNYVNSNHLLKDVAKVKTCFDSYQVEPDMIETIKANLEKIAEIYPYVDIAKNPPSNMQRRNAVTWSSAYSTLTSSLSSSDRIISKVFRATMKFIHSFHDGHFNLDVIPGKAENIFSEVKAKIPFLWKLVSDGNGGFTVYLGVNQTSDFLSESQRNTILSKTKVAVSTIDGRDAFKFLSECFEEYDEMKSLKGSLLRTQRYTISGFDLLSYPMEKLFSSHTVKYSDDTTVSFTFGFVNNAVPPRARDVVEVPANDGSELWVDDSNLKSFATVTEEMKALDELSKKRNNNRALRASTSAIQCKVDENLKQDFIQVSTFHTDMGAFTNKLAECTSMFSNNEYPIVLHLPLNGGGYLYLQSLLFTLLFPNYDRRSLVALRRTSETRTLGLGISYRYLSGFADPDNQCLNYTKNWKSAEKLWCEDCVDDLGNGVTHKRTKKGFLAYKEELEKNYGFALRNPRRPTDFIVVTDGYCFSACSFFVTNVIRTGAAIVTGYGATYPSDTLFAASQCPSTVVSTSDLYSQLEQSNNYYGLDFTTTFFESYKISEKMTETIPDDYNVLPIDRHLGYYETLSVSTDEIQKAAKTVLEEFKTKCNPNNERLLLVTDECRCKDINAFDVGHPCGSNGEWDMSVCKISSCLDHFVVDHENDKCIPYDCDVRFPLESSSFVRPFLALVSFVLVVLVNII